MMSITLPNQARTHLLTRTVAVVGDSIEGVGETQVREASPSNDQPREAGCAGCSILKRLAKGGYKLLKSELGVDAAPDELEAMRRATCEQCNAWDHGVCTECLCFTAAKCKLAKETCPRGIWPTIESHALA